jgi:hypothetical protein
MREERHHLSCPPLQWLTEPPPTKQTQATTANSPFVPATTVAGRAYVDRKNRGLSSALNYPARHHSCWLCLRRPREQRPDQRPQLSLLATTVAGWAHAEQANRSQNSAFTCRARRLGFWLSQRRTSDQMPEERSQLSCPPSQWLAGPTLSKRIEAKYSTSPDVPATTVGGRATPTKRTEAGTSHSPVAPPLQLLAGTTPTKRTDVRAAPSTNVSANTVDGSSQANQANRGHSRAVTCCAPHHSGWLSPRRPRDHRPEQRPQLSCPPTHRLTEPTATEQTVARAACSSVVPATTVAN